MASVEYSPMGAVWRVSLPRTRKNASTPSPHHALRTGKSSCICTMTLSSIAEKCYAPTLKALLSPGCLVDLGDSRGGMERGDLLARRPLPNIQIFRSWNWFSTVRVSLTVIPDIRTISAIFFVSLCMFRILNILRQRRDSPAQIVAPSTPQ